MRKCDKCSADAQFKVLASEDRICSGKLVSVPIGEAHYSCGKHLADISSEVGRATAGKVHIWKFFEPK